jgi:DNA-binding CsgD family transcriptional regulator
MSSRHPRRLHGLIILYRIHQGLFVQPLTPIADLSALGVAEREVAGRLLDGHDNARIARDRGTSRRTVANQVASIFRKLGLSSRGELCARL